MKEFNLLINGRFTPGALTMDVINPATGEAFVSVRAGRVSKSRQHRCTARRQDCGSSHTSGSLIGAGPRDPAAANSSHMPS